ncbi:MAG: hypothetical protein M3O26_18480 [Pseudomonadota bacterium]|nr:hypothetical protein [Pseudomonadota bacterium]
MQLLKAAVLAAVTLSATPIAFAQHYNWKDSHFSKRINGDGDSWDQRNGAAEDNLAPTGVSAAPAAFAGSVSAAAKLAQSASLDLGNWRELGPFVPNVPGEVTYTGQPTTDSGRIASIALSPQCRSGEDCLVFVGAAGGGVWRSENALDAHPEWSPSSSGLPSLPIGTITFDPTDPEAQTLYVGTGEPNGSSDSLAGVGLYKSTNQGESWSLLPGSVPVAYNRSIGAVAVDPANGSHIFIGTDVARRGSSAVNGGRFTPPAAPAVGLYESWDGGQTFALSFSLPADAVNPSSANGSDFFRGGINHIELSRAGLKPNEPTKVFFAAFAYGVYRSAAAGGYEQIFVGGGMGAPFSSNARTEFALAPMGKKLRMYVGDADNAGLGMLFRSDDVTGAAVSFQLLSNATPGTPGFGSYNFCQGQCSYDMAVASPAGHPDTVWILGSMNYGEIFTLTPPSNGRAVMRSVDGGLTFTDMTNDTQSPPLGMHPDQHAIAFVPNNPNIAIIGSDGGAIRTDGVFVDTSASCASRGITAAALTDCQAWLKAVPRHLISLNAGLRSMQFQSMSFNPQDPLNDIIAGTQDNGTWAYDGLTDTWFESVGGDGGNSGINAVHPNIRMHTYYDAQIDVNFSKTSTLGWDWIADPLLNSGEAQSFYVPLIADPVLDGTFFVGLQHVWRTQDNGGSQAYLDLHCNEFTGDFTVTCGDWVPVGEDLTGTKFGPDKAGSYVVAIARAPVAASPLWVATRRGRLFVSMNADGSAVLFNRVDTAAQPKRFISGIAVDPRNPLRAIVSFSGYNAYTPTTPGHVFEVIYDPAAKTATWKDLSANLGDQPILGAAIDGASGRIFVGTDFGVLSLSGKKKSWAPPADGFPPVAVYGISFDNRTRTLFAATHGRGIWRMRMDD